LLDSARRLAVLLHDVNAYLDGPQTRNPGSWPASFQGCRFSVPSPPGAVAPPRRSSSAGRGEARSRAMRGMMGRLQSPHSGRLRRPGDRGGDGRGQSSRGPEVRRDRRARKPANLKT
jgi:hypothetical protein